MIGFVTQFILDYVNLLVNIVEIVLTKPGALDANLRARAFMRVRDYHFPLPHLAFLCNHV